MIFKRRYNRIASIYDEACKTVDEYWHDKNPCGFINTKCLNQQYAGCKYKNGCCRRCIYQSDKGCITSNLTCKMFYCSEVKRKYKVLEFKDLDVLKKLSWRQRIILKHDYFSSREEVINDLYIGSVFVFLIRVVYRYLHKI